MFLLLVVLLLLVVMGSVIAAAISATPFSVIAAEKESALIIEQLRKAEAGIVSYKVDRFDAATSVVHWNVDPVLLVSDLFPDFLTPLPTVKSNLSWEFGSGTRGGREGIYACLTGFTSENNTLRAVLDRRLSGVFDSRVATGAACGSVARSANFEAISIWTLEPPIPASSTVLDASTVSHNPTLTIVPFTGAPAGTVSPLLQPE